MRAVHLPSHILKRSIFTLQQANLSILRSSTLSTSFVSAQICNSLTQRYPSHSSYVTLTSTRNFSIADQSQEMQKEPILEIIQLLKDTKTSSKHESNIAHSLALETAKKSLDLINHGLDVSLYDETYAKTHVVLPYFTISTDGTKLESTHNERLVTKYEFHLILQALSYLQQSCRSRRDDTDVEILRSNNVTDITIISENLDEYDITTEGVSSFAISLIESSLLSYSIAVDQTDAMVEFLSTVDYSSPIFGPFKAMLYGKTTRLGSLTHGNPSNISSSNTTQIPRRSRFISHKNASQNMTTMLNLDDISEDAAKFNTDFLSQRYPTVDLTKSDDEIVNRLHPLLDVDKNVIASYFTTFFSPSHDLRIDNDSLVTKLVNFGLSSLHPEIMLRSIALWRRTHSLHISWSTSQQPSRFPEIAYLEDRSQLVESCDLARDEVQKDYETALNRSDKLQSSNNSSVETQEALKATNELLKRLHNFPSVPEITEREENLVLKCQEKMAYDASYALSHPHMPISLDDLLVSFDMYKKLILLEECARNAGHPITSTTKGFFEEIQSWLNFVPVIYEISHFTTTTQNLSMASSIEEANELLLRCTGINITNYRLPDSENPISYDAASEVIREKLCLLIYYMIEMLILEDKLIPARALANHYLNLKIVPSDYFQHLLPEINMEDMAAYSKLGETLMGNLEVEKDLEEFKKQLDSFSEEGGTHIIVDEDGSETVTHNNKSLKELTQKQPSPKSLQKNKRK